MSEAWVDVFPGRGQAITLIDRVAGCWQERRTRNEAGQALPKIEGERSSQGSVAHRSDHGGTLEGSDGRTNFYLSGLKTSRAYESRIHSCNVGVYFWAINAMKQAQ